MCPLHDDVEARHEQEVKKAADATMAKVKADNPGLSDTDLMIEVSDRVKRGGAAQRAQHAEELAIPNPPPAPQYVQPHPFHHLVAAPVPFPLPLPNYPYRPPAPQAIWHPPQAIQHPTQGQGFVYPPRHNYHRHYQHPHQPNHRF
jgi:TRIAD3 protein (E3 ubiquitin-protein ligase RNF216)